MKRRWSGGFARLAALALGAATAICGRAGTDEAWVQRAALPAGLQPLLAVVIDRSAVTSRVLPARESYDPMRAYGAELAVAMRCDPAKVYWRRGPGPAPDCARQAGLDVTPSTAATGLHCDAARAALARSGFYVASRAAQWHSGPDGGYWDGLRAGSSEAIECRADRGRHGAVLGDWYASDGGQSPWTHAAGREIAWNDAPLADAYVFYSGNFLNYLATATATAERVFAEVAADALARALDATDELDVALIRVDDDGPDGGYIMRAPVANHVAATDAEALAGMAPAGGAPLAETLVETSSWLQGGGVRFGTDSRADVAAKESPAAGIYHSPFEQACRPVSVAFLTAAEPSDDDQAAAAADTLPGFNEETGGCASDCLPMLAAWMSSTDLRADLPGRQSASLSWIVPVPASISGRAASPADPVAFANVIAGAFQRDATVAAAPQLSAAGIGAIRADEGDPGVILGLVVPARSARWPGNLLRYALRAPGGPLEPPTLVDRDGEPAIDPDSGLPFPDTRSLWSDAPDSNLLSGGADGRLPVADARELYSNFASDRIVDAANRLEPGNPHLDRSAVGLGPPDPETLDEALRWLASQRTIGDPGPHAPIVVDDPASGRTFAFVATHDGFLHAIDAESGTERWAWMPKELLTNISSLMRDGETTVRTHGIDGPLVLHRHDPDGDGLIAAENGEHLWLLLGLGRGGARYYVVDISNPSDPRLLWSLLLPDADVEATAEPVVTRLAIAGSGQSAAGWVVLLSGGYDRRFDTRGATSGGRGNGLHVVDAANGRLLWSAGGAGAQLPLAGLASLPSAPRALDLDGNGYLDRAYLLDVTGSLWRIDFASGRAAGELASAQRLARLGTGAHRFHSAPDAALARTGSASRIALAAGSGWLARPRNALDVDRLYVIFDALSAATSSELAEDDLYDATDAPGAMPPDAPGWFVRLESHDVGEKVAGPAVIFDHVVRFQTYQPLAPDESAPCGPPRSIARRYALDVRTALRPPTAVEREEDEAEEVVSGLPVGMKFGFPGRWDEPCDGCRPRPFGIVGGETFDPGFAGDPVRTSWRKLAPPPASP